MSSKNKTKQQKLRSLSRLKKVLIFFEVLFAVCVILMGTVMFVPAVKGAIVEGLTKTPVGQNIIKLFGSKSYDKSVFDGDFNKNQVETNNLQYNYSEEYTNFILFGIDSRTSQFDEGTNSDSMVIVSVHNTTGEVKMVSIYRDTFLRIYNSDGTYKYFKVNSAYSVGGAEGAIDASNILKPALARGEIKCIGATTIDEYRKHIEKDAALERRFQTVNVEPPTKKETINILFGLRDKYESHHKVKITDSALYMAVDLADRYITDRYMPDKAIDLIDEAAAKVRISRLTLPPEIKQKELNIEKVINEKEDAIKNQDFEKAASLRDNERILKEDFEKIKNEWRAHSCTEVQTVDEDDIAKVVSIWTKVPVERLTEKESDKLLHLEDILKKRIVGQEEAIKSLTRAVKRARVGLKNPNRPIGTFIFCGPTGVGKTELCNVLAEVMFGKMSNLIRIDMSEYMEKHSVSRLIGAPPGYVGYEEGGQLSEAVRRKPYSVVLLDEIEKAHPDVFNILLQIMEDGRLTDGKGKVIDFKNTIVIMTSNVGAQKIKNQRKVGFDTSFNANEAEYEKIKDIVLEELKVAFKPEFLNRVDDIIVFNQLKEEDTLKIVNLMLNDTISRLKEKNIDLIYEEDLNKFLINKNKNLEFGARPLRGIINREIVDKLSDELLKGEIKVGDKLKVECKDEILVFSHR